MKRNGTGEGDGSVVISRALIAGLALGMAPSAGVSLVLSQMATGAAGQVVVLATTMAAFGLGLWAGVPEAEQGRPRLRDRWLSAAAPVAAAGAYASFSLLYQQVYPGPYWAVATLVLAVGVPAYVIGLLPPTLLAWSENLLDDETGERAGYEPLASLVLGVLGGCVAGMVLSALVLLPRVSSGSLLMIVSALLLAPLLFRDPASGASRETTIVETITPFGALRVTEVAYPGERQPERRLYLNEEEESGELVRSGAPTLAYVAAAESLLATISPPGAAYLFLGGGAYTLPRRMKERDPRSQVNVVELDPEITRIAYRYFGLRPEHRIGSIHGDARAYLEASREPRYDRIYVDVYGGHETPPYTLVTREGALALRGRLNPGGVVAMNLIGAVVGDEIRQPWSVVTTFVEVFPIVQLYLHLGRDYPDRQNLLMVAATDESPEFPTRAGPFELWPPDEWPAPEGVVVLRDVFVDPDDAAVGQTAVGGGLPKMRNRRI